jgi:hypothetical protein
MSILMSIFFQTVIPAALTLLVAYRGTISRTGRLRSIIRANVELLATLPDDHPSRDALTAHVRELVDTLVRREQLQFQPLGSARSSFRNITIAAVVLMLMLLISEVLQVPGLYQSDLPDPNTLRWSMALKSAMTVCIVVYAAILIAKSSNLERRQTLLLRWIQERHTLRDSLAMFQAGQAVKAKPSGSLLKP